MRAGQNLPYAVAAMIAVLCLDAPQARAQPDATANAKAEMLFQEALTLRRSGLWKRACKKFQQSQQVAPGRGTLLNIAECHERVGDLASAWAAYKKLLDEALAASDKARLTIAKRKVREIEPQLPRLVVKLAAKAAVAGLRVTVDGMPITASFVGVALPIDAGTHGIVAAAPGHAPWSTRLVVPAGGVVTTVIPRLQRVPSTTHKQKPTGIFGGRYGSAFVNWGVARLSFGKAGSHSLKNVVSFGFRLNLEVRKRYGVEIGIGAQSGELDYKDDTGPGTLRLLTLGLHAGFHVAMARRVNVFGRLEMGSVSFTGLDQPNPFTRVNASTGSPSLKEGFGGVAAGVVYAVHPAFELRAEGSFLYAPAPDGFRDDFTRMTWASVLLGLGYRF